MRPSDSLIPYAKDLTIRTAVGRVPVYRFIEGFLWITDRDGNRIRFVLTEEQVGFYKELCLMRREGRPIRANVLKARQLGFSTLIAGIIFTCTVFTPGQNACIIADTREHASNLFDKYNSFYDSLPEELKLPKMRANQRELRVSHGNGLTSSVTVTVQGDNAGRSGTYQFLHLSECAFWDNLKDTLVSLLQTVSNANVNSMVFLETTANGVNEYYRKWNLDQAGRTPYKALFYGWSGMYRTPDAMMTEYVKPDWAQRLQDRYRLDENQVHWYVMKWHEFDDDLDKLRQEFPSSPNEAFITSGFSVFQQESVTEMKERAYREGIPFRGFFTFTKRHSEDGGRIDVSEVKWNDSRNGSIRMYEKPVKGHPYVVSNDPAAGGADYYATQVFDNSNGRQVAVYHRNRCDADDCAYQTYCLARYYNDALLTGETNTTAYILQLCQKCGYRNIYQDHDIESLGVSYYNRLGYKTKVSNRQQMIDMFRMSFRDNPNTIRDYETLCEMETFQLVRHQNGTEKAEALRGSHDDLVMAACGFFLCRGQQRAFVIKEDDSYEGMDTYERLLWKQEEKNRERRDGTHLKGVYQIW